MLKKSKNIFLNLIPIIIMIGLIPLVANDYTLTGIYCLIIAIFLFIKKEKKDVLFFIFGFVSLTISEFFFVSTGVETFVRDSLLGIIPVWLPFLWGTAFIAIRRTIKILES